MRALRWPPVLVALASPASAQVQLNPVLYAPPPTPIVSASGGVTYSTNANNIRGTVTMPAGTTTTTITLGATLSGVPVCTTSDNNTGVTPAIAPTTTTIVISVAAGLGVANTVAWHCL